MGPPPSVFLCYRRADEPFAAALLGVALEERFGAHNVFLDTLSLRDRRRFEQELLARARGSAVLLVVIGKRWDRGAIRERLLDPRDWVRREILEARAAGARIMPVLVERPDGPVDVPDELAFLSDCAAVRLARPDVLRGVREIAARVRDPGAAGSAGPTPVDLDGPTVQRAALAMLRHVLPGPQQSMHNDEMVARSVTESLGPTEWLRFAGAGRSGPRRARGSGIVVLTDGELRLIELAAEPGPFGAGIRATGIERRPLGPDTTLRLVPRRLLGSPRADVHVDVVGHRPLSVLGMFREPAELLCAAADPAADEPEALRPAP